MAERVEVAWDDLGDLDLDSDNPRHEPGMARRDIISYLIGSESVLGLAKDIRENGLSPLDNWGAIRDPQGGFVVVEGNRRLAALLLLHDPSLSPAKDRRAFERLSRDFDPDSLPDGLVIPLVIFEDREIANKWIERKHNGQAGGIGPRSWTATQQARHFGEKTGNQLALALLEYAVDHKMITDKESKDILTTLTRFLSTPYVRRHGLGLTTGPKVAEFKIVGTQALFDLRLRQLVTDIANRANNATSRTNANDRTVYTKNHLETIVDDPTTTGTASGDGSDTESGDKLYGPDDTESSGSTSEGASGTATSAGGSENASKSAKSTHPDRRMNLVPETFNPSLRSDPLKRLLSELKAMTKRTPVASAIMVRVFLEAVTVVYLETRNGKRYSKEDKLHRLVHSVLLDVQSGVKAGDVELSKSEAASLSLLMGQVTQPSYVYSAAYLGTVAHGLAFPDWATLTSKWDELQPILEYIANNCEPAITVE